MTCGRAVQRRTTGLITDHVGSGVQHQGGAVDEEGAQNDDPQQDRAGGFDHLEGQ